MKRYVSILLGIVLTLLVSASIRAAEVTYYHTDAMGTPLAISDAQGKVVWKGDYLPFGEEHDIVSIPKNKRRFVGKEKDEESGLHYFGARYMDEKSGRFISPDQVYAVDPATSKTNTALLTNPLRLNRYVYGLNNPYRYVDPDGNMSQDIENKGTNPYQLLDGGGVGGHGGGTYSGKTFAKALWGKITGKGSARSTTDFVSNVTVKSHGKVVGQGTVDLRGTLNEIITGQQQPRDVFHNREGLLPQKPKGYYNEFVHPTPGINGPGSQRIIHGQGGELYYSPDHYKSFIPLN